MLDSDPRGLDVCLWLTETISRIRSADGIYGAALEALARGPGVPRSSLLLFDADDVMRFKAWRGLSDDYRAAVEGHSSWTGDTPDAGPIVVPDVGADAALAPLREVFARERIAALAFIPLMSGGRVIGKFMLYFDAPQAPAGETLKLAGIIAAQVAFAVERTRAQDAAEQNEGRLRFALDAAHMGTWEWDLATNAVRWSESLERLHDLAPGAFDGRLETVEREMHPDDRAGVMSAVRRAIDQGLPYEVEYRIVTAAGEVRWLEGKGRVEYAADGRPIRMSGACMNITRRRQAEIDRLQSAQEASRTKDEFLAVLSHELRTPLNAILGWAQLLEGGGLDAERQAQAIAVIARNARLQAQLIEQILDVSRIITGKIGIERAACRVGQLIDAAVRAIEPAAADRQIALTVDAPPHLPLVDGDATRLQQVIGNVLSNALKFTPSGGAIAVRCRTVARGGGDAIRLDVEDSGAGIAPQFLPYIFDRFRQADGTPTRQHGGLGLGLAIARHFIELHGGTIAAESEGAGRGTRVRIELPAQPAAAPAAGLGDPVLRAPAASGALAGTRVLVVDDQPDARQLLSAIFSPEGVSIDEAATAHEAIAHLERGGIDLLIADIGMPDIDGCDLIRRVRAAAIAVPAIAVTAYARPEDRVRALDAGFTAFVTKPFDAASLVQLTAALRRDPPARPPTTASAR
jgi:PAS domain S-box-containing protein